MKICQPGVHDGLQIRDAKKMNLLLFVKLGWNVWQGKDLLWNELLKKKYLRQHDFMTVWAKSIDSHT